ncbi:unnamed protein product [Trichobilharzia szidati]|nr:unnamed protein product [Trichobilharzia szidati]
MNTKTSCGISSQNPEILTGEVQLNENLPPFSNPDIPAYLSSFYAKSNECSEQPFLVNEENLKTNLWDNKSKNALYNAQPDQSPHKYLHLESMKMAAAAFAWQASMATRQQYNNNNNNNNSNNNDDYVNYELLWNHCNPVNTECLTQTGNEGRSLENIESQMTEWYSNCNDSVANTNHMNIKSSFENVKLQGEYASLSSGSSTSEDSSVGLNETDFNLTASSQSSSNRLLKYDQQLC